MIEKKLVVSGKRKTAVAKATIVAGDGKVLINNIPYQNLDFFKKLEIEEPIEIAKRINNGLFSSAFFNAGINGRSISTSHIKSPTNKNACQKRPKSTYSYP